MLEKAVYSFWKHGYDNTTTRRLEEDMGINQFSIYATFKNKKELFKKVLLDYSKQLDWYQLFLKGLKQDSAGLEDIKQFLLDFALGIKDNKIPNSCLMVSSTAKFDNFDPEVQTLIVNFFQSMQQLFLKALQNSLQSQQINEAADLELEAEYLVGIAQSISVYSKVKSREAIKKYIEHSVNKIR